MLDWKNWGPNPGNKFILATLMPDINPLPSNPETVLTPTTGVARALPEGRRRIGDHSSTRTLLYQNALKHASAIEPLSNARRTLSLHDIHFEGPESFSLQEQKEAILGQKTLGRKLKGTWKLTDTPTGEVIDSKPSTLAVVPTINDDGLVILNGSKMSVAHQLRLRPGIYSRRKSNGELEAHINYARAGQSMRVFLDPASGVFKINIGQANIPAFPLLRAMGATDNEIKKFWGNDKDAEEVMHINQKHDSPHYLEKIQEKLVKKALLNKPQTRQWEHLLNTVDQIQFDPEVNRSTLGRPYSNMSKHALLETTGKLLKIQKGLAEPDDRDHLAFQEVLGPEDLIPERLGKDKALMQKLLWNATNKNKLSIPSGVFNRAVQSALLTSGLAQLPEGISASELIDLSSRVSKIGQGGLSGGKESIPAEAKNTHPSQAFYIDPIKTPEGPTTGVDLRLAFGVQKGIDNRLYAPFKDVSTGRLLYRSPQQLLNLTVAFPGEMNSNSQFVRVIDKGKLRIVNKDQVDLEAPSMENIFSPLSNMLPFKSSAKGQRASMGARMLAQALPLVDADAPHVRGMVPGQPGKSWEELYAKHMGLVSSDMPGRVVKVTPDEIIVKHSDNSKKTYQLYNHLPGPRKTGMHNTALVQPGDLVQQGQVLAKSNFTNDKGEATLGKNAYIAYVPSPKGLIYEDSALVSESFAKKLTSEHYYQHKTDIGSNVRAGKRNYSALFPGVYDKKTLSKLDDNGVIKVGTEIQPGDPLILLARQKEFDHSKVTRSSRAAYSDHSVTWDHHTPGIVTAATPYRGGVNVVVRTEVPMQVGDKLCYDHQTEVLTREGWRAIKYISTSDLVATLVDGKLVYQHPTRTYVYPHGNTMYRLRSPLVDLFVTANHNLYVRDDREGSAYRLRQARTVVGQPVKFKVDADWEGFTPKEIVMLGNSDDMTRLRNEPSSSYVGFAVDLVVNGSDYAAIVGAYIGSGRKRKCKLKARAGNVASISIYIDPDSRLKFKKILQRNGITYKLNTDGIIRIENGAFVTHFARRTKNELADCISGNTKEDLKRAIYWFQKATGSGRDPLPHQLINIAHRLAVHAGLVTKTKEAEIVPAIRQLNLYGTKAYKKKVLKRHFFKVYSSKSNEPSTAGKKIEQLIKEYKDPVYCIEVPGNVLYIRRKGCGVWCGNSQRWGGKSVISEIMPDDRMPHDSKGRPFDMLWSPLQLNSRINPSWAVESLLGKVAEKTGKHYAMEDGTGQNPVEFALQEGAKHGVSDTDYVFDPETGRRTHVPVLTGNNFILKLHHQAAGKVQGRGLGAFSAEGIPTAGAKRLSLGDTHALLSSGALSVLQDSRETRSQSNPEFWLAYMGGFPTPPSKVPQVYEKFLHLLKGAGVNPVREGHRTRLMALTDKDVLSLAGQRVLQNAETVHGDDLSPISGGLFDPKLTGGHGSNLWSKIKLHERLPSPVFADPIKKILNLTEEDYLNVLSGKKELKGRYGPDALYKALENLNLDKEISQARDDIKSGKRGLRDKAVRKLGYLKALESTGQHPSDWFLTHVPVLPPIFRPISKLSGVRGGLLVNDPNLLYKELFDANENLKNIHGKLDDVSDERLTLYKAFEGVVGLGDPVNPKNQERGVRGLLREVFGHGPKTSYMQHKLLGTTVNLVGRGVLVPGPEFDMDSVGLPEDKAFDMYQPMLIRRLVRNGVPRIQALREVVDRSKMARNALVNEMQERPIIVNRYPLLHKFGELALFPSLVAGNQIKLPPIVFKGMAADSDGDSLSKNEQLLLMVSDGVGEERKEVLQNLENSVDWNIGSNKGIALLERKRAMSVESAKIPMPVETKPVFCKIQDVPVIQESSELTSPNTITYDVPEGVSVLSVNKTTLEVGFYPVSKLSVHNICQPYKVSTNKLSVTCSGDHSLVVFDRDICRIKPCTPESALKQAIPVIKKIERQKIIHAIEIPEAAHLKNETRNSRGIVDEISADFGFGWWCGAYISDGHAGSQMGKGAYICHSKSDLSTVEMFEQLVQRLLLVPIKRVTRVEHHVDKKMGLDHDSVKNIYHSSCLGRLCPMWFGQGAENKHLPTFFPFLPEECLWGLFSGLLEGDGSVDENKSKLRKTKTTSIRFNTKSERLADEVVFLGKLLGLRGTKAPSHVTNWVVNFSTVDIYTNRDKIKIYAGHKRKSLEEMRQPTKDDQDNVPVPYSISYKIVDLARQKKIQTAYSDAIHIKTQNKLINRTIAQKIYQYLKENDSDCPLLEEWKQILDNTNIMWQKVTEVTKLPGTQVMYDITVPETKVFALSNGLVVMDTLGLHVPVSDRAIKDAKEKMLPSRNLYSPATMKATAYLPQMEYLQGLHAASTAKNSQKPKVFATKADAIRAWKHGEIELGQQVEIVSH